MPIERIPVVHKFGILSRTHQEKLRQKRFEEEVNQRHYVRKGGVKHEPRSTPNLSPNNSHDNLLEEVVYQLEHETDDLALLHYEKTAKDLLKKIQFKLKSSDKKNIIETLKLCWKDLSSFISCKNPKIVEESLKLLKRSLSLAPLSKQIIQSLLGIGLCLLQELTVMERDEDVITKRYSNNQLLAETSFLLFTRLYYHHMASDFAKVDVSHQLEAMYLMNKGFEKIDDKYENTPIFFMYMLTIKFVVTKISKVSAEKCKDIASTIEEENKASLDMVKDKTLAEDDTNRVSTLLWNVLCIWKSLSRQSKLSNYVFEDIKSFDFTKIHPCHPLWMEVVLSLHILAECSKLDMKYLLLLVQLGPCAKINKKTGAWSLPLQYFYLKCLADVGLSGMTTDITTSALLGDRSNDGLASFLQRTGDNEACWKIRHMAYQLLHQVYVAYKSVSMKDLVCNALWDVLNRFAEKEKNSQVLAINKLHGKDGRSSECTIITKIATNFSIIYLPLQNEKRRKDPKKEGVNATTAPRKSTTKETRKPMNVSHRVDERLDKKTIPSTDETSWSELTSLVGRHFAAEVNEDEKEIKNIRKDLVELGLVEETTIECPVSATLPDVECIK